MKKYAIITLIICIAGYIGINFASGSQTLLDKTIEYNNIIYDGCFHGGGRVQNSGDSNGQNISSYGNGSGGVATGSISMTDSQRYKASTDCWKTQRRLTPDDLFLTVPRALVDEGKCSISQTEDSHVEAKNGGMYATDLACNFDAQGVYAPDYLDQMIEYKIESIGFDNLLGNFVILSFPEDGNMGQAGVRWYFGHTVLDKGWKVGDVVRTGVRFAHADLSGATTGWHTHIELRRMYDGVWQSVRYVTRGKERKLEEKRTGGMGSGAIVSSGQVSQGGIIYYFTHYGFTEAQTDSSPCVGADGKDSCAANAKGRGTMALTVDIRKKLGIQFGDKVALTGDVGCEGVYTVTDEMNCRFRGENAWSNGPCAYSDGTPTPRTSHIKRPGTPYYIKGDLPGRPGGACSISKL